MVRRTFVVLACIAAIGCTPESTSVVRPVTPPAESNTDMSGYGPCIEAARDGAGIVTDVEVERCVDEHL